jgi:hypothetical protein
MEWRPTSCWHDPPHGREWRTCSSRSGDHTWQCQNSCSSWIYGGTILLIHTSIHTLIIPFTPTSAKFEYFPCRSYQCWLLGSQVAKGPVHLSDLQQGKAACLGLLQSKARADLCGEMQQFLLHLHPLSTLLFTQLPPNSQATSAYPCPALWTKECHKALCPPPQLHSTTDKLGLKKLPRARDVSKVQRLARRVVQLLLQGAVQVGNSKRMRSPLVPCKPGMRRRATNSTRKVKFDGSYGFKS